MLNGPGHNLTNQPPTRRPYLVQVVKDDAELAKLLDSPRHINVSIQINREGGLIDDRLHACHSEVVVAVVKPGIDQTFFAEAEDLPAGQRTWAQNTRVSLMFVCACLCVNVCLCVSVYVCERSVNRISQI